MRAFWLVLLLLAVPVHAGDIDRPLESGVVSVRIRASTEANAGFTRSVGLRRDDTGELVFCMAAGAGEEVNGPSDPIVNLGSEVLLSASAFDAADCSGVESLPSADRYRIVFGAPGTPWLLPMPDT